MKNAPINTNEEYKYGFTTDIENIQAPKGLNEGIIKFISEMYFNKDEKSGRIYELLERYFNMDAIDYCKNIFTLNIGFNVYYRFSCLEPM